MESETTPCRSTNPEPAGPAVAVDPTQYDEDIPLTVAVAAHRGTSMVPDERGVQNRREYARQLTADQATLAGHAKKGDTEALLGVEFERFREGVRSRTLAWLTARGRCASVLVTGPANFPTQRNTKAYASADKRLQELNDFRERALKAVINNLRPDLRPVMAGDSDAVARLTEKIAEAERRQEQMKHGNAAIRKHAKDGHDAQVAALVSLGFSDALARQTLHPDCMGGVGFQHYELSNNGANIRRMQQRLQAIKQAQALPPSATEGTYARVEDSPADNRVRLFFPGKPAPEVRSTLKAGGFRWTPSLGCWQAYRNFRSLETARRLAGIPGAETKPEETVPPGETA